MGVQLHKIAPVVRVGDIVMYRSLDGVDMPAIVTAFTDGVEWAHLRPFPPPAERKDHLDPEYGSQRSTTPDDPGRGTWRPRERS